MNRIAVIALKMAVLVYGIEQVLMVLDFVVDSVD